MCTCTHARTHAHTHTHTHTHTRVVKHPLLPVLDVDFVHVPLVGRHGVRDLVITSFLSGPLGWCMKRCDHIIEKSQLLFDLRHAASNPFLIAQRIYNELLLPFEDSYLRPLMRHLSWGASTESMRLVSTKIRRVGISIHCQFEWRFTIPFGSPPFIWASIVDPDISPAERRASAITLFRMNICCLDAHFSLEMRGLARPATTDALLNDKELLSMLRRVMGKFKFGNMHIERLLALFKKACPGQALALERISGAGNLRQWLTTRYSAGGIHPGTVTMNELRRDNVPLTGLHSNGATNPNKARGHIEFMKHSVEEARQRANNSALCKRDITGIRRNAMRYWRNLPVDLQESWKQQAVSHAKPHVGASTNTAPAYNTDARFGLSSHEWPLRPDVFESVVRKELRDEALPGLYAIGDAFQARHRSRIFCPDNKDIDPDAQVCYTQCLYRDCSVVATGKNRMSMTYALLDVVEEWGEGAVMDIRSFLPSGQIYKSVLVEVGNIRKSDPRVSMFVLLRLDGTAVHLASGKDGHIKMPLSLHKILKMVWSITCDRLSARARETRPCVHTAGVLEHIDVDDFPEIWVHQLHGMRREDVVGAEGNCAHEPDGVSGTEGDAWAAMFREAPIHVEQSRCKRARQEKACIVVPPDLPPQRVDVSEAHDGDARTGAERDCELAMHAAVPPPPSGPARTRTRPEAQQQRVRAAMPWCGSFPIGPVKNAAGNIVAWGANCHRHLNGDGDVTYCCKSLVSGYNNETAEQIQLRLKRWLIAGYCVSQHGSGSRDKPKDIDPTFLESTYSDQEMRNMVTTMTAEQLEAQEQSWNMDTYSIH